MSIYVAIVMCIAILLVGYVCVVDYSHQLYCVLSSGSYLTIHT